MVWRVFNANIATFFAVDEFVGRKKRKGGGGGHGEDDGGKKKMMMMAMMCMKMKLMMVSNMIEIFSFRL